MFKHILLLFAGFLAITEALKCYQCSNPSIGCPDALNSTTTEQKVCPDDSDVCFKSMLP